MTKAPNNTSLYKVAAGILKSVHNGKCTIKNGCYNSDFRNKPILLKLVLEVCKEWFILEEALNASRIKFDHTTQFLLMVLIREFANDPKCKDLKGILPEFDDNKTRLRSEYVKAKLNIPPIKVPEETTKWVRMNTVNYPVERVLESLIIRGFSENTGTGELGEKEFRRDKHLKFLLQMNPKSLHNLHPFVIGDLIIQDKASCIPVHVLDPKPESLAIDACAAPGNKTTQLAAAVKGGTFETVVTAYEKDPQRFETLQKMIKDCNFKELVTCCNKDFLTVPPQPRIKYIVVDPSCSGSGMRLSLERQIQKDQAGISKERIASLANFQTMILKHALSFPDVQRVVYSTCSIFEEENEEVVSEILKTCPKWTLLPNPFPEWTTRGLVKYSFYKDVIRSDPDKDDCIGFFVACFIRKQ
jgi:25S rRNA (cytosine2278-C5)-methyltransferase